MIFIAIAFFANTLTVAAWAKPCMNLPESPKTQMATSDMPCHDTQDKSPTNKHCKGLCLCFHVSVSHMPILTESITLQAPATAHDKIIMFNDSVTTTSITPPRRPPKVLS